MNFEGYTFFFQNINKIFSLKCDIYNALTFKRLKILFKMQVTFISLNLIKGGNFTPYYFPLIWIEWNFSILFIK